MTGKRLAAVRRSFTRWAPWYDATHLWMRGRKAGVRALRLQAGESVLDVACGTGLAFRHLVRAVGEGGTVTAIDATPAMLDRARRRARRHGWGNVAFQDADAARLPFADASFDAALCAFSLHIIPEYRQAIRDMHRVLRPGGRLAVVDVMAGHTGSRRRRLLARLPHVCAIDFAHDVPGALQSTFREVSIRTVSGGAVLVALARK